jgi:peptide deformylase
MIQIMKYPDPVLLHPAYTVSMSAAPGIIAKLRQACAEMDWGKVMGMAAPQIGISQRVFLALGPDEKLHAYINPAITRWQSDSVDNLEGCYSLERDRFDYPTRRSRSVFLEWQDERGTSRNAVFMGWEAIVIQHEFDHLEGVLVNSADGQPVYPSYGTNPKKGKSYGRNS